MRLVRSAASAAIIVTVAIGLARWRAHHPVSESQSSLDARAFRPRTGLGVHLRKPLGPLSEYLSESGLTLECQTYIRNLEALDLTAAGEGSIKLASIPQPGSECNIEEERVADAEKNYLRACFLKNLSKEAFVDQECIHSLILLRAATTTFLTQKKTTLTDVQSMARVLFSLWTEPQKKPYVRAKILRIAEDLDQADPSLAIARKVIIRIHAESLLSTESQKMPLDAREAEWHRLEKLAGGEWNDLAIWVKTRGFEEGRMSVLAHEILRADPESRNGLLLSAFSLWKRAEYNEAFEVLKKASSKSRPGNQFTRILSELTRAGAGEEVFQRAFPIDLSFEDFDQ